MQKPEPSVASKDSKTASKRTVLGVLIREQRAEYLCAGQNTQQITKQGVLVL